MIFGKHINRYYLKYALWLLVGLTALWLVDYFQLIIPEMYRMVINGMNEGSSWSATSAGPPRPAGTPRTPTPSATSRAPCRSRRRSSTAPPAPR